MKTEKSLSEQKRDFVQKSIRGPVAVFDKRLPNGKNAPKKNGPCYK